MLMFYSGGHALGSGSDILYKPDGLINQAVADGRPLIWVAFNYRLGCKMRSLREDGKKALLISAGSLRIRDK